MSEFIPWLINLWKFFWNDPHQEDNELEKPCFKIEDPTYIEEHFRWMLPV